MTAPGYYFHFEHDIYPPIGPAEGLTGLCQMAGLYDDMLSWRGRAEYVNAKGERFGIGMERLRSHAITYSPDPHDDDTPVTFLTVGELREGDRVDREADFWLTYDNPDAEHELLIAQAQTYEVSAHSAPYDGPDGAVVDVHYEFDSSCGYPPGFTLPVVFRAPDEGEGYGYCDVCGAMCEAGDDGNGYCPLTAAPPPLPVSTGGPPRYIDKALPAVVRRRSAWMAWIPPTGPECYPSGGGYVHPPFGISFHPSYEAAAEYVREHTAEGGWVVVMDTDPDGRGVVDRYDTEEGARADYADELDFGVLCLAYDPLPVRSAWYATTVLGRES